MSCDAYSNEIISHVTQTDPVPVPGDECVAPPPAATYAATSASAPAIEHVAPVLSDFLEPPVPTAFFATPALVIKYVEHVPADAHFTFVPVLEHVMPAPVVSFTAPAPVIENVTPELGVTCATPVPVI